MPGNPDMMRFEGDHWPPTVVPVTDRGLALVGHALREINSWEITQTSGVEAGVPLNPQQGTMVLLGIWRFVRKNAAKGEQLPVLDNRTTREELQAMVERADKFIDGLIESPD